MTVVQTEVTCVNQLGVIQIRKVCESMRFGSGPEVFALVNRNYVLIEYVLNENDCTSPSHPPHSSKIPRAILAVFP